MIAGRKRQQLEAEAALKVSYCNASRLLLLDCHEITVNKHIKSKQSLCQGGMSIKDAFLYACWMV